MGAFDTLREFFVRKEPLVAHIDDAFVEIDFNKTARALKLGERGEEQGALNLPSIEAETLDNVEQEIVHEIGQALERAQIEGANQVRTFDGRLASLTLLGQLASIRANARTAAGDFSGKKLNWENQLTTSKDAIVESFEDWRAFKAYHGLTRPAHDVPSKWATGGAIFIAWAFESGLNTSLLRMNDAMGVLGGALAAGAIGAINVGISAAVGRKAFPYLQHVRAYHKVWAGIVTFAWALLLLIWNLVAAQYRDAKVAGAAIPEQAALEMFRAQPFALDSFYSWGLFAAGMAFALMAAIAGFKMDDPYPGYGPVYRRHKARCDDYSADVATAIEELREIRDEAISDAEDVRQELARQQRERDQILVSRESFRRRYEQHCSQLENSANALLEAYRTANRRARTVDPPTHFNERWKLNAATLPSSAPSVLSEAELREADSALEGMIYNVTANFDKAVSSFQSLRTLKAGLDDGA